MADPGRPRLPTVVKERQGTLEKSRTSPSEPEWEQGADKAPSWLKGPGLAEWKRLVPLLVQQGLFPATGWNQVAGICQQWGRWREAEEHMRADGKVITTKSGYQQPSPWVAIGAKAWSEYMAAFTRYGLDPASAGKVIARPKTGPGEDELAKARADRRASR